MLNNLIIFPVIIPIFAAVLCVIINNKTASYLIYLASALASLVFSYLLFQKVFSAGEIRYVFGNFDAPYGIEYRADYLSSTFLLLLSAIFFAISFFSFHSVRDEVKPNKISGFYCLLLLCYTGLAGITLSNDIFNIYVFIEIASLATYSLATFGNNKNSLKAAYDYLILGTIGATFILIGIGYIYITVGTLNIDDIQNKLILVNNFRAIIVGVAFLLMGIILKIALFPFHMWLVRIYTYSPSVISAFLASVATKIAIYLLIRFSFFLFGINFSLNTVGVKETLIIMAIAGIFAGSISALFHDNAKRVLAFSSIASIGVIILALTIGQENLFSASLLFLITDALAKALLFCSLGAIYYRTKNLKISEFIKIRKTMPITFIGLVIGLASLCGIPATAGFISKLILITNLFKGEHYSLMILIIIFSITSLVYAWRILEPLYFSNSNKEAPKEVPFLMQATIVILIVANIYFGIYSYDLVEVTNKIANQIFSNSQIIIPKFL
ncbi:MAG: proton-conducting transporter membrane subunit [Alphaproteobacteria bacterium]|jgi:multicomponent Na+:H+ antiporter subunit D